MFISFKIAIWFDSIILYYRSGPGVNWSEAASYTRNMGNPNDKAGTITLDSLIFGEYTLGIKNTITGQESTELPLEKSWNCYPNPAKEYTFVLAELGKTAEMEVGLYTITGLKVKDIASGVFSAGRNELYLDLTSLQNGVYLVKAKATASGKTTEKTMKVVVVK
jgi:hypothetical protein